MKPGDEGCKYRGFAAGSSGKAPRTSRRKAAFRLRKCTTSSCIRSRSGILFSFKTYT